MKHFVIPIFIPEMACPFQCVFCDQKKISGRVSSPAADHVRNIVETHLTTLPVEGAEVEIAYFGGNFTGIDPSQQIEYLSLAAEYVNSGRVKSIRLSTRPDYISQDVLKLLSRFPVKTIELGAQSMCDDVLLKAGRGHKAADVIRASGLIRAGGYSLGLQMMLGLPGDTLEKSLYTANKIIELGADNTRIYPTLVIKDTRLEELYLRGSYNPLGLNEAVEWASKAYLLFEKAGVNVLRIGLHPSEGLLDGSSLVAGPFHISFRELVYSSLWKSIFLEIPPQPDKTVCICIPRGQLNYAVGHAACNKKMLMQKFRRVEFKCDESLTNREYRLVYS